jgi:hypothetical protein
VIALDDRVSLAPGVTLRGRTLVDAVRGVTVPLTQSGALAIREPTPRRMAARLVSVYGVDGERAAADARVFCAALNGALFANVHVGVARLTVRWIRGALTLPTLTKLPRWPARRYTVRTGGALGVFRSVARALWAPAALVCAATLLPLLAFGNPAAALVAGFAAGLGLILHEAGHAVALRGVSAALVVRGVRVALLHRRLEMRREALVAAAGPLTVAAAACVAAAAVHAAAAGACVGAPIVLALHAAGLTVLAPDGRKICAAF